MYPEIKLGLYCYMDRLINCILIQQGKIYMLLHLKIMNDSLAYNKLKDTIAKHSLGNSYCCFFGKSFEFDKVYLLLSILI